ncbi:IclR family transcriptional regulator domain-containing protein [Streptomyces subrutilus]|uniref:IclR family transcriptional regulator domain-containing protein n=1 Tax=Streptomyces subrutilus TaxID=36818 RepID=UPI0033F21073
MERDLLDLKAVAVRQAYEYGAAWSAIGEVLSLHPAHARTLFSNDKVARAVTNRAHRRDGVLPPYSDPAHVSTARGPRLDQDEGPPGDTSLTSHPGYPLATALSHLQRSSGLTGRKIADELCISPSLLSRILLGNRTPKWRVVRGFAELCGADSADLRPLWDKARGVRVPPPPNPDDYPLAARGLQTTLRGMWLAAGSPDVESLCRDGRFTPEEVTGALGSQEPAAYFTEWSFVARLATTLRGNPDDLRALWEHLRASGLISNATALRTQPAHATGAGKLSRAQAASPALAPGTSHGTGLLRGAPWFDRDAVRPPRHGRTEWVLRVLAVVHLLAEAPSPLTLHAALHVSGLVPESGRRLMTWLEQVGLTARLADGTYLPGPLLLSLCNGEDVLTRMLEQLRTDAGAAVYLSTYVGGEVAITHSSHGPDTPPVLEHVPFKDSAHANAVGKAHLVQLDAQGRMDHLTRHLPFSLTPRTITDTRKLLHSLDTSGERGIQYDLNEYNDSEKCAAVPLTLPGRTGCVALSLPTIEHARLGEAVRKLGGRSTSQLLSLLLTYTDQSTWTSTPPAGSHPITDQPVTTISLPHHLHAPLLQTAAGQFLTP